MLQMTIAWGDLETILDADKPVAVEAHRNDGMWTIGQTRPTTRRTGSNRL